MDACASCRPRLAVWKFASCDGCQLSLLDLEDQLLAIAESVEIAYFLEATSRQLEGPYDIGLVEGSITTPEDVARIQEIRRCCRYLVTIGACATAGGIQALRNLADGETFAAHVYPHPEYIRALATSTPIAAHVDVDFELRGCPISGDQLLRVLTDFLHGRSPRLPRYSVCLECKLRGNVCVAVARGEPCLGPVTQAGCGALCPAYDRACFGCFGPQSRANVRSLAADQVARGRAPDELVGLLSTFNVAAPAFHDGRVWIEEQRGDA